MGATLHRRLWGMKGPRFAKALTAVMRDPRISVGAKALYVVLKTYAGADGWCYPSQPLLAACLDCTKKSVITYADELEAMSVITRQRGKGKAPTKYFLNDEHFAKFLAKKPQKPVP